MRLRLPCILVCALLASCAAAVARPDPQADAGRRAIVAAGCGACHAIPGAPSARGAVGPSLDGVGRRVYLAGVLPNMRANMILWISRPRSVLPGNAMPNTGLSAEQANAIASYLETLK